MNSLQLPDSLWAATAIPGPQIPALTDSVQTDVAIVGAGFAGLRTALELAAAGTNVCVVDAGDIGWGASGRNGGQVNPIGHEAPATVARHWQLDPQHEQVQRYINFTTGSANGLFELVRSRNIDCDAEQNGWIRAVHGRAGLPDFQRLFEGWQATGTPMRLIDGAELAQLSGTRGYQSGWVADHGGSVQPLSLARGLAHAALAEGAQIFTQSRVTSLDRSGGKWRLKTKGGSIETDTVVLCTNGYTDTLFKGLRETVVPVISIQAATKPLSQQQIDSILPQRHTFADTRRVIFYFRKTADNRLVFGSAGSDADNPAASDRQRIITGLRTVYPQYSDLDVEYLWGGRIAVTVDHLPHVHELAPGLIAGLGCNGRGVAMATSLGKQLATYVLERDATKLAIPLTQLKKFPLHRFSRVGVPVVVRWSALRDRFEAMASRNRAG